jgi:hypothetical protein
MFDTGGIFLYIALAFVLYFAIRTFHQLVVSPLKVIPGPWYAAISDFWATTHLLRMQQCKSVDALFNVYGPIVRVGPNKVFFRDLESMKNVYSVLKFEKSEYYRSFLLYASEVCHFFFCYCIHIDEFHRNDNDHT